MRVKITFRVNTEEQYTPVYSVINVETWDDVLYEIKCIEACDNTVLLVQNLSVD